MKTNNLKTPYTVEKIPHSYHPTPNFRRDSFICLNGEWDFKIISKTHPYSGKITVPFPPEATLSGVERIIARYDTLCYERKFTVDSEKRLLLHFGAVDNECFIMINNKKVGEHLGGYLPFFFDITDFVSQGENTLTVLVTDCLNKLYPYGKQCHKRGGMWYTPISGIWQTVWLQYVPESYIESIKITTTLNSVTIKVKGGAEEKKIILEDKEYSFSGYEVTINLESPKLWTPEEPNIYYFSLLSGEDKINSYFALREIKIKSFNGNSYICLNEKPYFFHGLLDQGYFPDGIYIPTSSEGFKEDILKMKALGFNMLRKHIKIEPQIFYYYCDIYGMAVFQDFVNNGNYNFFYDTALPTIGLKRLPRFERKSVRKVFYKTAVKTVNSLHNHPSVVYYTIFNEGWGQHNPKRAFEFFSPLDNTRIWDTASGWFKTEATQVQSEHIYFKKADFKIKGDKPAILSEFGGYSCSIEGHRFNPKKVYGYKICDTPQMLTKNLERLYSEEIIPLVEKGLNGCVLTQVSDVEDETNGLLTYDRLILKPEKDVMLNIAKKIQTVFNKKTENI